MNSAKPDRRKALLAKVHIAKKELLAGDDDLYRMWIMDICKSRTDTAAKLTEKELEALVRKFKDYGWKDARSAQVKALQGLILATAKERLGKDWVSRLKGIMKKTAGTERIEWVRTVAQLRRLLGIIRNIE